VHTNPDSDAARHPDSRATETAIAFNIFATLTASAPQLASNPTATNTSVASAARTPTSEATAPLNITNFPTVTATPLTRTTTPTATRAATAIPSPAKTPKPSPTIFAPPISPATLHGKIIFKSARNGGAYPDRFAFFVMDADGSNLLQLPRDQANALYNQLRPFEGYSPDRTHVVVGEFACNAGPCFLYILDPQLNPNLERSQGQWTPKGPSYRKAVDPVWSPDGSTIAFVANWENDRTANVFKGTPFQTNPNFKRLTDFGGQAITNNPSFSPDGSTLAFATTITGHWQIWLLDPNGDNPGTSNPRNISNTNSDDWGPLWIK
jgi:hypothetical protein